jgi:maltose-binding protein MalE
MKKTIGIVGVIAIMFVLAVSGCTSSSDTTNTETTQVQKNPTTVTITQLYGTTIKKGSYVKVTGKVLQTDGSTLRMENAQGQDILVNGVDLNAYEDKSATVIGTFVGPTSYDTAMGSSRTVPTIDDAKMA